MSGTHEGRDAGLQALGGIGEKFEKFHMSPDELVEEGDTIVVLSHLDAKSNSGTEIKLPGVEVWRMSGGKAKRVQRGAASRRLDRGGRQNHLIDGFVDIHSHILPGIDDGPSDLDESLAMARAAVASGTATIVATPHLNPDFPGVQVAELAKRCGALRAALEREQIRLELISGGEVSLAWAVDADADELALATYGQRGQDLLIESPFTQVVGIERFLSRIQADGYRVTLAHPERNPAFQRDAASLRELVEEGVLLQVNAESLIRGPRRITVRARQLVSDGLAHVIASDGHRAAAWRPVTRLADAVEAAAELVGPERARWLVSAAPRAIVTGGPLPEAPPAIAPRRRRWLFGRA